MGSPLLADAELESSSEAAVSRIDVLVVGRSGQLALSLVERARATGITVETAARPEVDLADAASLEEAIAKSTAPIVINSAAYTAVDQAESEPDLAERINAVAPGVMAVAAARRGARLIHVSTDYVFDGRKKEPYLEEDAPSPLGVYGRTKLAGEEAVRAAGNEHAIVRTAWVYSPFGRNFVKTMLALGQSRPELRVVGDQMGTPTSALDLADGLLAMVKALQADTEQGLGGTYHLAGTGETSWAGLALETFSLSSSFGGPAAEVTPIPTSEWPTPADRPRNSRLSSAKFEQTFSYRAPAWQNSLRHVVQRLTQQG